MINECGCPLPEDGKRKWGVESIIHKHPAASRRQKRYTAKVMFYDLNGDRVRLCPVCIKEVIDGMGKGGNHR